MNRDFLSKLFHGHSQRALAPSPKEVHGFFNDLLGTLFPDFARMSFSDRDELERHLTALSRELNAILSHNPKHVTDEIGDIVRKFFSALEEIHQQLTEDVIAMYEGDPAAKSEREVVRTYPGFYAIAAYRIAHTLHRLSVADIPRMITEHAHSKTGIDIHPAARIGRFFCIDHGTGIVIGETALIGDRVKLYQGVTLGALSVSKEDAEKKRHPTLEDNVVVYAGATILGGETVVGRDSIIGGNVWLTSSVPANSKVYYQSRMYNGHTGDTDMVVIKS